MELYATGLNAWSQLRFGEHEQPTGEPDDISYFTCVLADSSTIEGVHPFLSHTVVHTTSSGILTAGLPPKEHHPLLALRSTSYSHFAQASNGVSIFNDTYPTLSSLTLNPPWAPLSRHFPSPPLAITQLVSYSTGFATLSSDNKVHTWGDERYAACLGRDLDFPGADAPIPGEVSNLFDLPTGPITKLAAGGYVLAALTEGKDLYIWGHAGRAAAAGLTGLELSDEPEPVVIDDHDIVDVGVGEAHVIVLTTSRDVFVIGSNGNGQLGLGREIKAVESWTKVSIEKKEVEVVAVAAGPRNSFLVVR